MSEQRGPLDVGFADFVAVLLVETLESILAAHTSQEERLSSLRAASSLTVEEFAQTGISDDLPDATAAQPFPDDEGDTNLVVGGPIPSKDAQEELGVSLRRGDSNDGGLTGAGVKRVREALALYLARRHLSAMKEAEARGVPRVFVEGGTLRAKLNFTAVDANPKSPTEATTKPTELPKRPRLGTSSSRDPRRPAAAERLRPRLLAWDSPLQSDVLDSIRRTRLLVTTPVATSTGETEPTTSRTEVFGEVEIRFRMEK